MGTLRQRQIEETEVLVQDTTAQGNLETDIEEDETPFVEYDISVNPADLSLELLSEKYKREEIIIPPYQRKFVWKPKQASELIESFLMGLPVPQIFLYENDEGVLEVIDGQQRLLTVHFFFRGYFEEISPKDLQKVFRLNGLSQRSDYNGKTYSQLASSDQRKLKNKTLRVIFIKQLRPSGEGDAVFHIFKRLNTGGTLLKAQEIRNAVYRGPIVDSLRELNSEQHWQEILGLSNPDRSQKDVELILRLFALFENWENYKSPMSEYLNKVQKTNRDFSSEKAVRFKSAFNQATRCVADALEKPFRPKRLVNSAALEAVFISLMEEEISSEELKQNYASLLEDSEFAGYIFGGTANEVAVKRRIELAKDILKNGAKSN